MKRISTFSLTVLFFFVFTFTIAQHETPQQQNYSKYQKMKQGFTYFGHVYQKVNDNYVDDIDPLVFIKSGIEGMLENLDPYTEFLDEDESKRMDLITTGRYGGIGIEIAQRNEGIIIMNVVENSPAFRGKVISGDYITHINNQYVLHKELDDVSNLLKGNIGETITLQVKNSCTKDEREIILTREEINVYDVPYSGYVSKNIGYIKLASFSENAADEVIHALKTLEKYGQIKGLILDLRNNPGGLLESARQVTNLFVPKGELIITTYGKKEGHHRVYSTEEPMFPDLPLVILINEHSASASEIVAGCLQDLDRALILGQPSFGKGLVQKIYTIDPVQNIKVKITTAKYYTPSGRCIQKKNLFTSNEREPSTHMFFTRHGRPVKDGEGIVPDIEYQPRKINAITRQLFKQHLIFDYALLYINTNTENLKQHRFLPLNFQEFKEFISQSNFTFKPDGVDNLEDFLTIAKERNYSDEIIKGIEMSIEKLLESQLSLLENNRDEILEFLHLEIAGKFWGVKGKYETRLKYDGVVQEAILLTQQPQKLHYYLTLNKKASKTN